ncbi:MAG: hypothetical protein U5K56_19205 [Halioglobus sp.]|nr:hypothetical protein [Halioglobus sp.]
MLQLVADIEMVSMARCAAGDQSHAGQLGIDRSSTPYWMKGLATIGSILDGLWWRDNPRRSWRNKHFLIFDITNPVLGFKSSTGLGHHLP